MSGIPKSCNAVVFFFIRPLLNGRNFVRYWKKFDASAKIGHIISALREFARERTEPQDNEAIRRRDTLPRAKSMLSFALAVSQKTERWGLNNFPGAKAYIRHATGAKEMGNAAGFFL